MNNTARRLFSVLLALLCLLSASGCRTASPDGEHPSDGEVLTDVLGNTVVLSQDARVVICSASLTDCWLLSGGGTPVGVTADAFENGVLAEDCGAAVVGSSHSINAEAVIALEPDCVFLSADMASHRTVGETLRGLGISCAYFRLDTFADYKELMVGLCALQGREDLYALHVGQTEERINAILAALPKGDAPDVLLIRAYSTGMKAKTDDNTAGRILKDLAARNIADDTPSLLEELSAEQILARDPDYIFILTMGNEESALAFWREQVENHPAWASLTAVREGRCHVLPKDLFHYKPNGRWDESYEYLASILYPEILR